MALWVKNNKIHFAVSGESKKNYESEIPRRQVQNQTTIFLFDPVFAKTNSFSVITASVSVKTFENLLQYKQISALPFL
jgi:hypothetical protein